MMALATASGHLGQKSETQDWMGIALLGGLVGVGGVAIKRLLFPKA